MSIIDRYIIAGFARVFLICFLSLAGLYIVVDAFSNLEELGNLSAKRSWPAVIGGYYGPRALQFFDKTSAYLTLIAAIFCLAFLQRSNELTAIQAAGISDRRVARPILAATLAVLLLSVVNRELVMPWYRVPLAMNFQDMQGGSRPAHPLVDPQTGIQIRGTGAKPAHQQIENPKFRLPENSVWPIRTVEAQDGTWLAADASRPAGYRLTGLSGSAAELKSGLVDPDTGRTLVYTAGEVDWVQPGELFVVSSIDPIGLAFADNLIRNSSLYDLIVNSRYAGSAGISNRIRVDLHGRVVQPVFDLTILLIGLPLVLVRGERNLFVSAGICLLVVMFMSLVVIACHGLGVARLVSPPALAAWVPVILFAPIAWVAYGWLGR